MRDTEQFLDVIDRDEAERRFRAHLTLEPLGAESIPLDQALGRVLAVDVASPIDVPGFDRSNVDGFAIQAADVHGASEERPRRLTHLRETIPAGHAPQVEVRPGTAATIATGGMLPRGADAVAMIEHADVQGDAVVVRRTVAAGFGISFAGSDISAGAIALRMGTLLTCRETGVLAALGASQVSVLRRPRVAIVSTGDEVVPPGAPLRPAAVFDSNGRILADAVRELGGVPLEMGVVGDDAALLRKTLTDALGQADAVVLSGGTSKGAGDLCYRVVAEETSPGIVAHGVALKPGKPICLAAHLGRAVVVLPGFPTSAVFTFFEFVAPVIAALAGRSEPSHALCKARLARKINSEVGRTEYLLVGLVDGPHGPTAFPMGKGSGSVTTFSAADGIVTIGRHTEIVEAGSLVDVRLLSRELRLTDLVVIGSHCVGLDAILSLLQRRGLRTKLLAVGSTAGLEAVREGQCDLAGVHLLDPATGEYNAPFLTPGLELAPGYERQQGFVFRRNDPRFAGLGLERAIEAALSDHECRMVNRNQGSGTRLLIDRLIQSARPPGYAVQARSHSAVVAAIAQGRADWGVAIEASARQANLGFLPVACERFDFVFSAARRDRPGIQAFLELLATPETLALLTSMGLTPM